MLFKTKEDHDREIAAKKKKIREALEKEIQLEEEKERLAQEQLEKQNEESSPINT